MKSKTDELDELLNREARVQSEELPTKEEPVGRWASSSFRRAMVGAGAAVLLLTAGLIAYNRNRVSTDDAQVDGHIVPVSSKVYGNVVEVLVNDNEPVKRGQVLVRIAHRDYQVKVDQAKAALAVAESQAQAARIGVPWSQATTASGSSGAEARLAAEEAEYERAKLAYEQASTADVAYARANVEKSQANYDRAKADLERMKPLFAKAEISEQQYDAFLAAARVAEGELKANREKLTQALQKVGIQKAAVLAAGARVNQAQAGLAESQAQHKQVPMRRADAESALAAVAQVRANLEAAELQLSYATITAPRDGVVTKKSVEVGQVVQPGQELLVLVPLNDIWVTADFKETQLAKVRPGQKAEIKVDMYGKTFTGHVDSIAGATGARLSLLPPENATGNFVKVVQRIPVKIVLDLVPPEKAILRPGMNVEATILTK